MSSGSRMRLRLVSIECVLLLTAVSRYPIYDVMQDYLRLSVSFHVYVGF